MAVDQPADEFGVPRAARLRAQAATEGLRNLATRFASSASPSALVLATAHLERR